MAIERIEIYDVDGNLVSSSEVTTNELTQAELLLIQQQNELNNPLNVSFDEMFALDGNWIGRSVINTSLGILCIWNGEYWINTLGKIVYETLFSEDFEDGVSSELNILNSEHNEWVHGGYEYKTGTSSLYVSCDGGETSRYRGTCSGVSHVYVDFNVPQNLSELQLRFTWKGEGELSRDYMSIYYTTIGTTVSVDQLIDDDYKIDNEIYNDCFNWCEDVIKLDTSLYGERRLVFSWITNNSSSDYLGVCLDNINIEYIK